MTGNVNSASEIKILSNQKPQEIDAQETGRFYEQKTDEHVRVKNLPKHNILVKNAILARYSSQGCALAEPSGPWCLTFVLARLENLSFFIEIICWAHWISQVQSTALPSIFFTA